MVSDQTDFEAALLAGLAELESGQLSDVLDEAGFPDQVLSSAILPLMPGQRLCGPAACARGAPLTAIRTGGPSLPVDALESIISPGSVLVIETGAFTAGACLGGLVAYSLQRTGCAGLITDGAVRDAEEIRAFGWGCFSAAVTPVNGARRWSLRETDTPVVLPGQGGVGVRITPGDYILADADGVVVVPRVAAAQIVEDSERLRTIERTMAEELRAGAPRAEVFRRNPRFDHVRRFKSDA